MTRVHSFLLRGIDAAPCEIEADISPIGQPKTTIVGLPDAAVKESAERVRTAMLNSGFVWPQQRITINLAPADQRKEGPVYDLPVAMAMLLADGTISPRSSQSDARRAMRPAIGQVESAGRRDDGSSSAPPWPSVLRSGGPGGPGAPGGPERAGSAEGGAVQEARRGHDQHDPHDQQLAEFDARLGLRAPRRAAVERPDPDAWVLAGELALDGRLRPVRGVISLAMMAKRQGRRGVVVPMANAREAAVVDGIEVRGAENLAAVVGFFNGVVELPREPTVEVEALVAEAQGELDFGDVRGQESAKRAMTIAAAGGHNILFLCPSDGHGRAAVVS